MHKKKTAKSLNKAPPILAPKKPALDDDTNIQFELELCWCIQQMQLALNTNKLSQKVAEDTAKNLKVLTSQTAPLIKKRQVMKLAMGDYRSKMKQEEKKMMLASKQIKFTTTAPSTEKKSSFVKKSALLTSGKDFRFNFAPPDNNESTAAAITQVDATPASFSSLSSILQQTNKEATFKFNFAIEDPSEDINISELNINT